MNSIGFSRDKNTVGSSAKKKVNFGCQEHSQEGISQALTVTPPTVCFASYEPEQLYISKSTLRNCSDRPIRYNILSPKNPVFTIKCQHKSVLNQDGSLDIYIYFKGQRAKIQASHSDKVVINYDGGHTLELELQAKPPIDLRRFSLVLCEDDPNATQMTSFKKRLVSSKLTSAKRVGLQRTVTDSEMVLDEAQSQTEESQKFLQKYRELWQLVRERKSQLHSHVGNEPLSREYIQKFQLERRTKQLGKVQINAEEQKEIYARARNRFSLVLSDQCPIVDRGQNKIVRWNQSLNDSSKIKMYGTRKLLQCVWRYIVGFRVEKAKEAWGKYLSLPGSHQQTMAVILSDINTARRNQLKLQVNCQLNFQPKLLKARRLPVDLERFNIPLYNGGCFAFEVNARIGFDDWIPMQELCENYQEVMSYQRVPSAVLPEIVIESKTNISLAGNKPEPLDLLIEDKLQQCKLQDIEYKPLPLFEIMANFENPAYSEIDSPLDLVDASSDEHSMKQPGDFSTEASQVTTGINIELHNYMHRKPPREYDCGFDRDIESAVDHTLGEPQLDDMIKSEWAELPRQTLRLAALCQSPRAFCEQQIQPIEPNHQHTLYQHLQHELYLLKLDRLREPNATLRSYNKFVRSRKHKFIF